MNRARRPLVAISSCLLGERVRYDGDHKRDNYIAGTLSQLFDWKPVCPEVGAGLGTPRPPIQLVGDVQVPRAVRVNDPGVDVTELLTGYSRAVARELAGVSGYIFKSRSPSCALRDARLFDATGTRTGYTSGLHARLVMELFPALALIDELQLQDDDARECFLQQVFANWQLARRPDPENSPGQGSRGTTDTE